MGYGGAVGKGDYTKKDPRPWEEGQGSSLAIPPGLGPVATMDRRKMGGVTIGAWGTWGAGVSLDVC